MYRVFRHDSSRLAEEIVVYMPSSRVESHGRPGMTLIELIICVAILVTAMMILFSQILPLSNWQRITRERGVAMTIAQGMAERLQGAAWHRLGTRSDPWSWHRRETPHPTQGNPPLTEDSPDPDHNLIEVGLLSGSSGLQNLQVFVEYYDMEIMDGSTSLSSWRNNMQNAQFVYPESPDVLTLTEVTDAVVFRILVVWEGLGDVPHRHEITLARRR